VPIFMALIFVSSIFVVFTPSKGSEGEATIIVDLGFGKEYEGKMAVSEDTSLLLLLSHYTNSIEIENGSLKCVMDYCNNVNYAWKIYKIENETMVYFTGDLEDTKVKSGEAYKFVYEYIGE